MHVATGPVPALRFPGQWFQAGERDQRSLRWSDLPANGLHQNWHRDYDLTTGRYLQPDPLGLVDGASVYGYARQSPLRYTDPTGQCPICVAVAIGAVSGVGIGFTLDYLIGDGCYAWDDALFDAVLGGLGGAVAGPIVSAFRSALGRAAAGTVAAKEAPLLLNGPIRITEKGMAHVVERHTVNDIAKFAGKSKFNEGENLSALINSGTQQRMVQQANGNFARTWDAGRSIGIDRVTGQQTSVMTVITRQNGELVTAFPGRP